MLQWLFTRPRPEERARQFGRAMLADPVIRPYLRDVQQYPDYALFLVAHRAHWEQSQRFEEYYQEQIARLGNRIMAAQGLDGGSTRQWDARSSDVVQHLKDIMWSTWERHVGLESLYNDARWNAQTRGVAPSTPRLAIPLSSPPPEPSAAFPAAHH